MTPVPLAKRAPHSFSTLAETADEYIRLECARRRNHPGIRRRASLVEQFGVRAPSSRLRERRAQIRRHAFLTRKDNKAAIDRITDRVRELAELDAPAHQLSPMEKNRLLTWAESVDSLLNAFEPSENHSCDPVVRMLEKLQFLQDAHVCLAEVALDARALLEKWDRDNVFDASGSSEDDCPTIAESEDAGGSHTIERDGAARRSVARNLGGHGLTHSYAYETVRQRAAANLIKRCVVRWARAQESFCDRVDEIQLFGKTTSSLMQELTSTVSAREPTVRASSDIFDLVKVKQSGMYAPSIGFNDMMRFSKHIGLFSVDQAIRRVEELKMKRYLYMARCALKMQTIWRKARKEFQARRMQKLVETLRLEREKQKQEERERERERELLSRSNKDAPGVSEGKRKSVLPSSKKSRAVSVSSAFSSEAFRGSSRAGDPSSPHSSTPQNSRLRSSVVGVTQRKESSVTMMKSSTGNALDGSSARRKRFSKDKSFKARSRFDDDDGDTIDIESAWQAFLDTATLGDTGGDAESGADGAGLTPAEYANREDVIPGVVMPEMNDNDWINWSDGEESDDLSRSEDRADHEREAKIAHQLSLAVSTALPPTPAYESGDGTGLQDDCGTVNRGDVDVHMNATHGHSHSDKSAQFAGGSVAQLQSVAMHGFHFNEDADRFRAKKTRVGTVSRMIPFAEFVTSDSSAFEHRPSATTKKPQTQTLRRLHELEFETPDTKLALLQQANPLVKADDSEVKELGSESFDENSVLRTVRVRRNDSTRKSRVDIIKTSIAGRNTEIFTYPAKVKRLQQKHGSPDDSINLMSTSSLKQSTEMVAEDATDSRRQSFVYPIQKLDIRRDVVMRRAQQPDQQAKSPEKADIITPQQADRAAPKKLDSQDARLRSTGIESTMMRSPRLPPPRLHTPHRPSMNTTAPEGVNAIAGSQRRAANNRRLKRFLPTLERRVDASDAKVDKAPARGEGLMPHFGIASELPSDRDTGRQLQLSRPRHDDNNPLPQRKESFMKRVSTQRSSLDIGPSHAAESSGSAEENDAFEYARAHESSEVNSISSDEVAYESSDSELDSNTRDDQAARNANSDEEFPAESESRDDDIDDIPEIASSGESAERNDNTIGSNSSMNHVRNRPREPLNKQIAESDRLVCSSVRQLVLKKRQQPKTRHSKRDQEGVQEESHNEVGTADNDTINSLVSLSSSSYGSANEYRPPFRVTKVRSRKSSPVTHQALESEDESPSEVEQREPETAIRSKAEPRKHNKKLQARRAELQRLMMQYLGLLQCGNTRAHER